MFKHLPGTGSKPIIFAQNDESVGPESPAGPQAVDPDDPQLLYSSAMEWEHKGIRFMIELEPLGVFFLASAKVPKEGMFVRVRPFSALGKSEEEALQMLRDQIRMEYRRLPEVTPTSG